MGLDKNIRQVIAGSTGGGAGAKVSSTAEVEELDFSRLVNIIWRSKWLVALMIAVGIVFAWAQLQRMTPLYTATSTVLWETSEQNISGLEGIVGGPDRDYRLLISQSEIITSGRLMGRVVDELNLVENPIFNPMLREPEGWTRFLSPFTYINLVRKAFRPAPDPTVVKEEPTAEEIRTIVIDTTALMVEPEWEGLTYVLNIEATTPDPEISQQLADEVARLYILDSLETKFEATRQATDWLTERVAELRVELEEAENRVEEFTSATTLVSEEALEALGRQLKELRERREALGEQATQADADREAIIAAWGQGDLAAVAERLDDNRLVRLAGEIAAQQNAQVRQGMTTRFERAYEQAQTRLELEAARSLEQQKLIANSITDMEAKIEEQSVALVEQRQLTREAEASRLIYEFFLGRLKEISIQEGIQRPDARILTSAREPRRPSEPDKKQVLALGAIGGMMLGFLLAFLVEQRNTSFRSARDLEGRTGQPVIGSIPVAPVRRRSRFVGYLADKPTSSVAEAFRNLRTSLLLANVDNPPQVIMTTSSMPGEGKTTCCVALAQISQAMGKRTLIIECDIRRRTFDDYFQITGEHGLIPVLEGDMAFEDAVEYDEKSGLFVLAGASSSVNAADLFASQQFANFLTEMRETFDFVFIDTPPVLAVPDARVIARHTDAVLFCVRWNHTPRDIVAEGLRQFEQVGVRLAGLVLSQINMKKLKKHGRDYGGFAQASRYYND